MASTTNDPPRPHGGARPGAGRKKTGVRRGGPHRARPDVSSREPIHVTLRLCPWVGSLRTRACYRVVHRAMAHYLGRAEFRFVHASLQRNHLHLLVEAATKDALRHCMQGFAIRVARGLNGAGSGQVFSHRYHAVAITSPRQARNSLAYVLNNWRRHRADVAAGAMSCPVDPYSTGVTFAGWSERPRFTLPTGYAPLPTSAPSTSLLLWQWRRYGLIDPFERPGPLWP